MAKPLLSIGIIFKNEIRCLGRCLESLRPLREALPCELVMADTGSDDGSRGVAAKYADILFDFPWIDDFAAARNAVMNRCSGTWFLFIDADEWLDPDIRELVSALTKNHKYNFIGVKIRNYKSKDLEAGGLWLDSVASRIMRMSTGARFQNAIHETWPVQGQPVGVLRHTMFYHDGYLDITPDSRKIKETRNLRILRKRLEETPKDLILLLQCYESSWEFPQEHREYLDRAMCLVEGKQEDWEKCGPAVMRYAVSMAFLNHLPELDGWIARAEEQFSDSIIIRIDVNSTALYLCWNRGDYAGCVRRGEAYFQAIKDYEQGSFDIRDITAAPPNYASGDWQQTVRSFLATAYFRENQVEKCAQMVWDLFRHPLSAEQAREVLWVLVRLHMLTETDTAPMVLKLWERINEPAPNPETAKKRLEDLNDVGGGMFESDFRLEEDGIVLRSAFSLFAPLEDRWELGRAAAVMEVNDPMVLEKKLSEVENWTEFPIQALAHALERGVSFPLPDKPMNLEEMDALAGRLIEDKEVVIALACKAVETDWDNRQKLTWARGLVMAAVRSVDWNAKEPTVEQGMSVARAFAKVERKFLPCCYALDVLRKENLFILPSLHRFGWFCAQAFEQLDAGDSVSYVRLLREGLSACPGMRNMVEFLTDHTPELHRPEPSDELRTLAEQIRVVLSRFSPDDPAVAALKQSEAYQKVAYLIEGTAAPIVGGLRNL